MKRMKLWLAALLVGGLAVGVQAEMALIQGTRAANKGACQNNLKAIGDLIAVYGMSEGAQLPTADNAAGLAEFGGGYSQCASRHFKSDKETQDPVEKENSYLYFGGFNLDAVAKDAALLPLVCDKPGNNHWNVLFADMHVESYKQTDLQTCAEMIEFLATQKEYSKEQLKTLQDKAQAIDEALGYERKAP